MYQVHDATKWLPERPETLGSKAKVWLLPDKESGLPETPHLFKIGRPRTGENWAEKVACEIAKCLDLPCANYELAIRNGERGVLSERFIPQRSNFAFGNLVLAQAIPQYNQAQRYKQSNYQLGRMLGVLRMRGIGPPLTASISCAHLGGYEVFIGYLMLDALVGNTDRHHDNWGVIVTAAPDRFVYHLGPTFDHASSMGREQTVETLRRRLTTRDQRDTVEAYASRCKSAFFGPRTTTTLTSREVLMALVQGYPQPTKFWAQKAVDLSQDQIERIFRQIDPSFITEEATQFALRLLTFNAHQIREVVLA